MPSQHAHAFPARYSGEHARCLAQGTWALRAVRSTRIELAGDYESAGVARRAVESHFGTLIGDVQTRDVRLLVSELVTNAIRHGEGAGGVVMYLAVSATCARVEVCDGGSGFDFSRDPLPVEGVLSGLGLRMVDVTASRWGVAGDDGTCVWFEVDLG